MASITPVPLSQAAALSAPAAGGAATISSGGVYNQLNFTGSANPVIDITSRLTLTGPGNGNPIITTAAGAHLRVINTILNLGSATSSEGGELPWDVFLDRSEPMV